MYMVYMHIQVLHHPALGLAPQAGAAMLKCCLEFLPQLFKLEYFAHIVSASAFLVLLQAGMHAFPLQVGYTSP